MQALRHGPLVDGNHLHVRLTNLPGPAPGAAPGPRGHGGASANPIIAWDGNGAALSSFRVNGWVHRAVLLRRRITHSQGACVYFAHTTDTIPRAVRTPDSDAESRFAGPRTVLGPALTSSGLLSFFVTPPWPCIRGNQRLSSSHARRQRTLGRAGR